MYLNTFALGPDELDMTATAEFAELLQSADDLGIARPERVRYVSRNVVANGLRFHVLEWGEPGAPAVVVLHGGHQTAHSWDLVSLSLAGACHVIAVDQRGHGDTEWPRDAEMNARVMATDVHEVIARLGVRHPVVAGHSMGGLVTMRFLLQYPGVASRAVLVDVAPEVDIAGAQTIRHFVATAREFDSVDEFVQRVVDYDPFRSPVHIQRTARYNLMQRADGRFVSKQSPARFTGAGAGEAALSSVSFEELAGIRCPVLLVRGAQSNILTPELAARTVDALPDGSLVEVARCGHNVHSQNTPGFLAAVAPFVLGGGQP